MVEERPLFASVARAITPTFLGFIGVLLLVTPVRLFEGGVPTPMFPLVVIFFWSIYGPGYVPSISTFLIGFFQDLMLGGPIGIWMVAYLLVQYLVITQRDYFLGRDQHVVWLGFAICGAGAGFLVWLTHSVLAGTWVPVVPLVMQMLVTIACYPIFAIVFAQLHRRVIIEQ